MYGLSFYGVYLITLRQTTHSNHKQRNVGSDVTVSAERHITVMIIRYNTFIMYIFLMQVPICARNYARGSTPSVNAGKAAIWQYLQFWCDLKTNKTIYSATSNGIGCVPMSVVEHGSIVYSNHSLLKITNKIIL